ncbi:MAG: M28 family peptidase [Bacteroidota bacterium]
MKIRKTLFDQINIILVIGLIITACDNGSKNKGETTEKPALEKTVDVPDFNSDSAYAFIETQIELGPRVPNTEAHTKAGDYFIAQLKSYGAEVVVQDFDAETFDGTQLYLRNIIGSFFPDKQKRILLAAHWDTRPFADKDTVGQDKPIDGANDGASGVGVLLEIARVIGSASNTPNVGVDIILFDGEDWGEKHGEIQKPTPDGLYSWWCLGSQYWSQNKHDKDYSAYYGILLDMVGASGSQFAMEGESMRYAPSVMRKVWDRGNKLGYSNYFVYDEQPGITDDHVFVNELGKIPMINIVHYDPAVGYFGDYHHSSKDNLDIIDKKTLEAVGETVLNVLYYE